MKLRNQYLASIPAEMYERTPKAVFAAIAVSYALRCGDGDLDDLSPEVVGPALLEEWRILYENQIVPQRPLRLNGVAS